jgi:phage terminase Nu1 subunit (DNA packaging protein)
MPRVLLSTHVSAAKIAEACNLTPQRVQQLMAEGMPRVARGKYDLVACVRWYIRYLQRIVEQRSNDGTGGGTLGVERARLARWQADRVEQEVGVRSGELLDADVALAWIEDMASTVKSRLAQIPDAVANQVDVRHSAIVAAAVRKLINETLAELADRGRPGAPRYLGKVGAAAHVNGQRVGRSQSAPLERGKRRARSVAN